MNDRASAKKSESAKHSVRINELLERLKSKLINFVVLDSNGNLVGKIKDVQLDKSRQLNLAIVDADRSQGSRQFLLRSSHIDRIDYPSKTLLLDITKTEIQQTSEDSRSQTTAVQSQVSTFEAVRASDRKLMEKPDIMTTPSEGRMSVPQETENDDNLEYSDAPDAVEEEVIRLLEERLVVNLNKRKIGEVIIRKQIETRMIQVPVHYEKLIVEQVGPHPKILAEIDLEQEEIADAEPMEFALSNSGLNVSGDFASPKTASLILDAISKQKPHGCQRVRVQIVLEDSQHQQTYQEWFDRCSGT